MAQQSSGQDLQDLGLDLPTVAPPEYAPPRPALPEEDYKAPSRPVSVFTTRTPAGGSTANSPTPQTVGLPSVSPPLPVQTHPRLTSQPVINVPGPSSSSAQPAMPQVYLSAAEEKEQQRRRFEQAHQRVASASGSMSSPPPPVARYDDIPRYPTGSGSGSHPPTSMTLTAVPNGGLSEKEQLRRYQEAQDRVARGGSAGPSTTHNTPPSSIGHAPIEQSAIKPAIGALSEKEQMRRYYEAQDRVAQANGQASGSGSSPQIAQDPPPFSQSNDANPSGSRKAPPPPTAGLGIQNGPPTSALSEKEQMRRFYEAQDRVARAAAGQSSPPAHRSSLEDMPSGSRSDALEAPAVAGPSRSVPLSSTSSVPPPALSSQLPASGSGSGSGYMSAEAEKEMMRRRFEDAQAAVERRKGVSSPPPPIFASSSRPSSPPLSPEVRRDPTVRAGKAEARPSASSSDPVGPPPPLAPKPPREYIDLLSPTGGAGSSFALGGPISNGASASGSGGSMPLINGALT